MSKRIPVEQAVGMVLPHDVTEIVRGKFKGRAFKKGHIIRSEDVEHLRRIGKDHIFVFELSEHEIHENEAAYLLAHALSGSNVDFSGEVVEGKVNMTARVDGLLKIDRDRLLALNMLGDVICATLHDNTPVSRGEQVAATRLIPLLAERKVVEQAVQMMAGKNKVVQVIPLSKVKAGIVITGNEVFYGRIKDGFEAVLREKITSLGSEVIKVCFAPDDAELIGGEITNCLRAGAELIITSGGMSVDPDDVTRMGIKAAGGEDMVYGTPVLPGAMFLSARIGNVPVLGTPACGMFHRITVLDLVLPRILAGEAIGRSEFADMGHGGLCRNCKACKYPVCGFGK
jgi:hypothetical protein